jgi:signal recognition particle receptor subunit beta
VNCFFQPDKIPVAKKELHRLLEHRELARMPLLILGNKCDCAKVKEPEMIKSMFSIASCFGNLSLILMCLCSMCACSVLNLDYITENPWVIAYVSAKRGDNIETAVEFLIQHSHTDKD